MSENDIHGVGSAIPPQSAVSVYTQDAIDDFPVLKAFQQYIDAEQAKARKRLLSLGVFFGILTGAIIAVFVALLIGVTARNQQLNDRLVEYAMKDRAQQSPVVVQPPQDNAAILALTAKLDELQKKLDESRAKAEKDAAVAAERARAAALEAAKPKGPTPEELEIKRLNALLAAEREKAAEEARREKARIEAERAAAEKERRHQEELEAYRRKHYPELYGLPKTIRQASRRAAVEQDRRRTRRPAADDLDEDLPDEDDAINYFDDDEDSAPPAKQTRKAAAKPAKQPAAKPAKQPAAAAPAPAPKAEPPPYQPPAVVNGKNSRFRIPAE